MVDCLVRSPHRNNEKVGENLEKVGRKKVEGDASSQKQVAAFSELALTADIASAAGMETMSVVGSFHHHPAMHDGFPFAPNNRCHQDHPFLQSWFLNQGALSPDYSSQPSCSPDPSITGAAPESGRLAPGSRRGAAAPRKERRRTESINSAFAELRECIPNVPADTKLSKIKTLRLATSYIAYLMDTLAKDSQIGETEAFNADLKKMESREGKRKREANETVNVSRSGSDKKMKGRTGWPQQVWALELSQ